MINPHRFWVTRRLLADHAKRPLTTPSSSTHPAKAAGDISSVFPSLKPGVATPPLPQRFADLKRRLIHGHEKQVQDSWYRLLAEVQEEIKAIKQMGSKIIPEIEFKHLHDLQKRTTFRDQLRKCGVAVVRGVVSEKEALGWKELLQRYIRDNPSTKGFPPSAPVVFELYWSPSQILARAHPNLLRTQAFLMSHWHSSSPTALISPSHPLAYADRLRIRQPGDSSFTLGPHIDSGSCERWEENGYGRGGVYDQIFEGRWEDYDPWESSCRIPVVSDLYNGAGGCSMLRMFQGWLSMSTTGAGEGTLLVNPLFKKATAYLLLRPFFQPRRSATDSGAAFLDASNWILENEITSTLQGAVPSNCQELNPTLHPHLDLQNTMIHIPDIRPGDYVAWHCDTIHAVDPVHTGATDSSVLYIPSCPLTEANAEYLKRQRETLFEGTPAPDYPTDGVGESQHFGRLDPDFVMQNVDPQGLCAIGLKAFEDGEMRGKLREGERKVVERGNEMLGFG